MLEALFKIFKKQTTFKDHRLKEAKTFTEDHLEMDLGLIHQSRVIIVVKTTTRKSTASKKTVKTLQNIPMTVQGPQVIITRGWKWAKGTKREPKGKET